jgi:RHS repeat-associated protein
MALTRNYSQRNSSWNAQYSFTGKIKDAETGYNYFGARYYDSGLSVWLSVDPMSDKYPSMSPYNYCANNPIRLCDPNGKWPGDFFLTEQDAAKDFGILYNDNSIRENREYGLYIYKITNAEGVVGYTYTNPARGSEFKVTIIRPENVEITAYIHTHSNYKEGAGNNVFSDTDLDKAKAEEINGYVVCPNGTLQIYDFSNDFINLIDITMPGSKDDSKKYPEARTQDPTTSKYNIKQGDTLQKIAKKTYTTEESIIKENNLRFPIKLIAGKELNITN